MLELYNTLNKKLEEFKPLIPKKIGIYSCGPTVYWNQHIGNMYAYIHWDTLVRYLTYLGNEVRWVMNITDVGHLTSDEDTGEDKMEKGAKREGLTVWQIADKYIEQFLESVDLLNIQRPNVLCRATEHIQEQIDLIKKIEKNGLTYKTKTGLVFDTAKFPDYARFANLNLDKQNMGKRVEIDPDKRSPWDFLLWVTNQPNHIMKWESPWGVGFPGWHIECTAMSTKYLGETFDIHTGGMEHINVHHTNEIAQGFGAFGHGTANFWLHNGWLLIDGEKVSKSLGNIVLVTDLIEKGINPLSFRYFSLNSNYKKGTNFTWEALRASDTAYKKLLDIIVGIKASKEERTTLSSEKLTKIQKYTKDFEEVMNDNLNTPGALAVLWEAVKSNIPSIDKLELILDFDRVLGLRLGEAKMLKEEISQEILELAKKRESFRKEKKWKEADVVREQIEERGYMIEDKNGNSKVHKK